MVGAVFAFQRPFRQYTSMEGYDDIPLPPDWQEKAEWVFARLMYPEHPNALFGGWGRFGRAAAATLDWREGGTSWTQDYPRADRHFAQALRRLTRVHVRSVEQPVDPDDIDDFFNWPWMNAGEMGDWKLTGAAGQDPARIPAARRIPDARRFLGARGIRPLRREHEAGFPRPPGGGNALTTDPIFHSVYDLDDRYQVPGQWGLAAFAAGGMYRQRAMGTVAHWCGIYDDKGRVMVAMSFNSDIGDSWEWADDPRYPEKYSALGIRIGVNYVVYAMTH